MEQCSGVDHSARLVSSCCRILTSVGGSSPVLFIPEGCLAFGFLSQRVRARASTEHQKKKNTTLRSKTTLGICFITKINDDINEANT